jgi:Outer membrane lipoprotein-sorting protein
MLDARRRFLGVLVAALLTLIPIRAGALSVAELVHRADHVLRGETTAAVLEMQVHKKSFDRTYSMVFWGDERGGQSRALVKVLGPARFRGHGTLKVNGRLSLYDPRTDRVTVLSGSMLGDDWMGSHFSNDDLVKETDLVKDYQVRDLGERDGEADGKPVRLRRIWLEPTPRAPVSWDHLVIEVYQQGSAVLPARELYFRKEKQATATRTLTFGDVKSMNGRVVPTRLVMRVAAEPGEYTALVYKKVRFDADLPATKFSEQALKE